jgi:hypothetical protein
VLADQASQHSGRRWREGGVWGLAVQQWLPRRVLDELPRETIYAQIKHVGERLVHEATYLVRVLSVLLPNSAAANTKCSTLH